MSVLDGKADVSTLAPLLRPRVLNDPVVLSILLIHADNGNSVIDFARAVVLGGEQASLVESPAVVSSGDVGDKGSLLQLALDSSDVGGVAVGVSDPLLGRDLGGNLLALLVSAGALLRLVGVVRVGLRADLVGHLPVPVGTAACATARPVVAVHALLLRQAHRSRVSLDRLHRFLHSGRCKRPA